MHVEITHVSLGVMAAFQTPNGRDVPLADQIHLDPSRSYFWIFDGEISKHHVASSQNKFWASKTVYLSKATHDWTHLRLINFKFIEDYDDGVRMICFNLRFVKKKKKEPPLFLGNTRPCLLCFPLIGSFSNNIMQKNTYFIPISYMYYSTWRNMAKPF